MGDPEPVRSTGIGSWPGTDVGEAVKIAFELCPELPYLPELPARGPWAGLIGRSAAWLHELPVDLQPAGWRLSDTSGRDHRRAVSTLRSDLDQLEEQAQEYAGPVKLSVAGPWTMAASMERPRGDRVLADPGARRELNQSLAEGIVELLRELRRRLPEIDWLVQLDEPLLPTVLAGGVPTASGLGRHRSVDIPEVSGAYSWLIERVRSALGSALGSAGELPVLVHCCAADVPVGMLRRAGIAGVLLDLDLAGSATWDEVAEALEADTLIGLGALPTGPDRGRALTARQVADRALRPLRQLGLDPEITERLLITPACGLAGFDRTSAVAALRTVADAARFVTDEVGA